MFIPGSFSTFRVENERCVNRVQELADSGEWGLLERLQLLLSSGSTLLENVVSDSNGDGKGGGGHLTKGNGKVPVKKNKSKRMNTPQDEVCCNFVIV